MSDAERCEQAHKKLAEVREALAKETSETRREHLRYFIAELEETLRECRRRGGEPKR